MDKLLKVRGRSWFSSSSRRESVWEAPEQRLQEACKMLTVIKQRRLTETEKARPLRRTAALTLDVVWHTSKLAFIWNGGACTSSLRHSNSCWEAFDLTVFFPAKVISLQGGFTVWNVFVSVKASVFRNIHAFVLFFTSCHFELQSVHVQRFAYHSISKPLNVSQIFVPSMHHLNLER